MPMPDLTRLPTSFHFPGWFFLVLSLKVFLPERTLWRPERTRRRCGCFGETATRRSAARACGSWRRMRRKGRRRIAMCSATTGEGTEAIAPGTRSQPVLRWLPQGGCVCEEWSGGLPRRLGGTWASGCGRARGRPCARSPRGRCVSHRGWEPACLGPDPDLIHVADLPLCAPVSAKEADSATLLGPQQPEPGTVVRACAYTFYLSACAQVCFCTCPHRPAITHEFTPFCQFLVSTRGFLQPPPSLSRSPLVRQREPGWCRPVRLSVCLCLSLLHPSVSLVPAVRPAGPAASSEGNGEGEKEKKNGTSLKKGKER